ncbi:ATP-dependent DNA/RNA helicase DHX36-like [Pectinophora gossypiella]|nr:ATP-dependent DNA/RNA helicase DHX36-like [Pectinophora gossypiella]XP_049875624.1 ATP-dependent DNA/RNA helicase DHX36-like [Pectinophora gossypiella]XP_049875626.1 ATP-dependent DNA/RNA helicase DHX36-like [Pectinophora gossypiella]
MNRRRGKDNRRPLNAWDSRLHRGRGSGAPPGLRGKALGLYYRDRQKNLNLASYKVNFGLPPAVENRVTVNLQKIIKLAARLNIPLAQSTFLDFQNEELNKSKTGTNAVDDDEFAMDVAIEPKLSSAVKSSSLKDEKTSLNMSVESIHETEVFKAPNTTSNTTVENPGPSTSSTPDFIPISSTEEDYGSGEPILSLRGGGDYKYGYQDIITGSFDEKLDECLAKGVSINLQTDEIKQINEELLNEYDEMIQKDKFRNLLKFRKTLPTYKKSEELLEVVKKNQVVVISGETGCGKSTQVPQLILDEAICDSRGANIHIIVTQPRRIAASSLATRVAEERGERLGNSTGYAVRLEKVDARPRGSIMYVTTGVLLTDLEINQGLVNFSHVILDEVHERDCHIDFTMCMLKKVLKKRKDLKLILMSATLDAEKLSEYFDGCPMLHIEGLAYPVEDIYLEDILLETNYQLPPVEDSRKRSQPHRGGKRGFGNSSANMEKEIQFHAQTNELLNPVLKSRPELNKIRKTLIDPRIEELNPELIVALLQHICKGAPGAILVFLPGIGDITKLIYMMRDSQSFPSSLYEIYPLHSKLPSLEQHKIFERPPEPVRKIIIATNIAETSITIDDIVYVIDCAKIKVRGLNVEENLSTLKNEWVAQANLRQRRGRAGRCQAGICYHLVTSYRAATFAERLTPEIQRSDLLEEVLMIKRLRLGKALEAMTTLAEPPATSTVEWAVKHLQQVGALDDKETLTPLGWHLARLPVHPSAGKLLLLGSLFGCLDRAASVAAVWGFKDPFQLVIGKEKQAEYAKRALAEGEPSDHVAISEAILQWESCPREDRRSFAYDYFLSRNTIELLSDMKRQFGDNLKQMGFLPSGNIKSSWENRNSNNLSLFKAVIAASLYPKVAFVRWTNSRNPRKQKRVRVQLPIEKQKISVHPSSVVATNGPPRAEPICNNPGGNWMVYWLKQRSTSLFLLEVTIVFTLPILFFGELMIKAREVPGQQDMCVLTVCSVDIFCKKKTANLIFQLRALLDQVLESKVMVSDDRGTNHSQFEETVLNAVVELITAEDERVDYYDDEDDSDRDSYSQSY